jgi:hypothetical protein
MAAEISTFEELLPSILAKHGPSWAVIAKHDLQGTFPTYREATEFALERFMPGAFLIRHTQEQAPYIPFVVVED